MKLISRLFAASLLALTISSAADARPFTAKDMVTLDRLSDPRVSPDGRHVVYAVRTMDFDANRASMSLWIADLKTGVFNPNRHAVLGAGASKRQQVAARLEHAQAFGPYLHFRNIVVPLLAHEGQAIGRVCDDGVHAVISHAA